MVGVTLAPEIILAVLSILIVNATAIAGVFINLNVKIAETAKDVLSIRNDMEEHKAKNKDDINELKEIMIRDKSDNREDHKAMMLELAAMSKSLADFKLELIKMFQRGTGRDAK